MKPATKIGLGLLAILVALLIVLPGNTPGDGRDAVNQSPAGAKAAGVGGGGNRMGIDCDLAAERAREFIAGRAGGNPEDWALTLLRERGEFDLAFVVDQVFDAAPKTPETVIVVDVKATCRRMNGTGSVY